MNKQDSDGCFRIGTYEDQNCYRAWYYRRCEVEKEAAEKLADLRVQELLSNALHRARKRREIP